MKKVTLSAVVAVAALLAASVYAHQHESAPGIRTPPAIKTGINSDIICSQ